MRESNITERPLAAKGLASYRCKSPYGWVMIGASDDRQAMVEAKRSCPSARQEDLQVWNGSRYQPVHDAFPERAASAGQTTS